MATIFSGNIMVQYGQFYLQAGSAFDGDMEACFASQANGLCGAAQPGVLFLVTGLHTGLVGVQIRLLETDPGLDDKWEEVVEASLQVDAGPVSLVEWAEAEGLPLALMAGSYRVRYQGNRLDEANQLDTNVEDSPVDHYRIDLWSAPPRADRVVKQTSAYAAYWHKWVGSLRQ